MQQWESELFCYTRLRVGSVGSFGIRVVTVHLSEFHLLVQVIVEENNVDEFIECFRIRCKNG